MKRVDMLIAAVLAVAVLASTVGVLTYEDARGMQTFRVTWETREVPLGDDTASLAGAGDAQWTLQVAEPNLTSILIEIVVQGGAPRVQEVAGRAELQPPVGEPVAAEFTLPASPTGAGITVPLEVPLASLPPESTVDARSREEAIARALPANATAPGAGAWTITLNLASTAPGPLAGTYTAAYTAIGRVLDGSAAPILPDVER